MPALLPLLSFLLVLLAGPAAFADGITQADSNIFTLDLTGTAIPGAGGITRADSADFTLDLTDANPPGAGKYLPGNQKWE